MGRIEEAMDEAFDLFTVVDFAGDLYRKAICKVRISEDEYLHILTTKTSKAEAWYCRYSLIKSLEDPILDNDEDYDDLIEREHCAKTLPGCSASNDLCVVM